MQIQVRKTDNRIAGYATEGSMIEDDNFYIVEINKDPDDSQIYWSYYKNNEIIFDEALKNEETRIESEEEEKTIQMATFNDLMRMNTLVAMPAAQAFSFRYLFEEWQENKEYKIGDRFIYKGKFYKVNQNHTSLYTWLPTNAPSLYTEISDPSIEYPEWVKPTHAENAYSKGAKVTYNGNKYISLIDANVWSPDEYPAGWKLVS